MQYLKQFEIFKTYTLSFLKMDILSGLIVSLVSLPLAMSFAISAGVSPVYGLYSAIFAGLISAIFGGSESTIVGPAGAFIATLSALMIQFGYTELIMVTFMAGVIMLLASLFKLGQFVQYVPYPVIIGFTAGIGVIIMSTQFTSMLGLVDLEKFAYFHQNIIEIFKNISAFQWQAVLVSAITIFFIEGIHRFSPKLPAPLIGVILSTVIVVAFKLPVLTIEAVYGVIPQSLPSIAFPAFSLDKIITLLPIAMTVAALATIESLLSAVSADTVTGKRHNSDQELIGVGLGNIVASLFGGVPVSGAIARTTLNVQSGSHTRVAAIVNALSLLVMMLLLAPLVGQIPLAALAGLLILISVKMIDFEVAYQLGRDKDWSDLILLMVTFLLTVFINLTVGIAVGLSLAALVFIKRLSDINITQTKLDKTGNEHRFTKTDDQLHCEHIAIYTIDSPLFFGTARSIVRNLTQIVPTKAVILRLQSLVAMDVTGIQALKEVVDMHSIRHKVYISGVDAETRKRFARGGLVNLIGDDHIFEQTKDAINMALKHQKLPDGCNEYKLVK